MSDALERLKKRRRPTVSPRDASLTPAPLPTPAAQSVESVDIPISRNLESSPSAPADSPPVGHREAVPLQTKQTTLRLEQGVGDRLQTLTRSAGLCREVLIEAMFEYCEAHPEAMAVVLELSHTKNDYRQQAANLKRAQSMMQRFNSAG